jgi:hypothetical protein
LVKEPLREKEMLLVKGKDSRRMIAREQLFLQVEIVSEDGR